MTQTSGLLLLDANVVIALFERGLWPRVVERRAIHLAATVLDEARFFEGEAGRAEIDLQPWIRSGAIRVVEVPVSGIEAFRRRFTPNYIEQLDPGETESLAWLDAQAQPFRVCSADKIVFRVLAVLGRSEQGVSLEEVLDGVGLSRKLPDMYTKRYREIWTRRGFGEGLWGEGRR